VFIWKKNKHLISSELRIGRRCAATAGPGDRVQGRVERSFNGQITAQHLLEWEWHELKINGYGTTFKIRIHEEVLIKYINLSDKQTSVHFPHLYIHAHTSRQVDTMSSSADSSSH